MGKAVSNSPNAFGPSAEEQVLDAPAISKNAKLNAMLKSQNKLQKKAVLKLV